MDENLITLTGWSNPPLYIPVNISKDKTISSIWADKDGDLFVGIKNDSVIIIPGIGKRSPSDGEMNKEGNFILQDIISNTRKIFINGTPDVYAFTNDIANEGIILLATSKGLARLKKKTGEITFLGGNWNDKIKITNVQSDLDGNIWFGTVGYGMGAYNAKLNEYFFYDVAKQTNRGSTINSFCRKSGNEFFVAVADSLPAIFNITDHSFTFITDTIFNRSKNNTTDIKVNGFGNLFTIKGGALFYSNSFSASKEYSGIKLDSDAYAPFIYDMQINHRPYFEVIKGRALPNTKEIRLNYNQNQLDFNYSLLEFWNQSQTVTEWKLDGLNMDWVPPIPDPEKFKAKFIPPLSPGKYVFRVRAKVGKEAWRKQEAALTIVIAPPFWQTKWFWGTLVGIVLALILFIYMRFIILKKQKEKEKALHEKDLIELEAKALRAQMNPHFVFNSLNSIKSLINKNENETAASYLTTFSKLIRTLFQNSDKREVSLYEELETCKLYTQLEKMRFGDKVEFVFDVDESIDLKDFKVPALILQPFIENAIWHGLMPKETGGKLTIQVKRIEDTIQCIIEDNGIGRELSMKNKPQYESPHQSKGIGLTQSRLELDKLLNERDDKIFIIDKEDESGKPEGTKVIISFKENIN
jgi:two-component sensor histidine kinase